MFFVGEGIDFDPEDFVLTFGGGGTLTFTSILSGGGEGTFSITSTFLGGGGIFFVCACVAINPQTSNEASVVNVFLIKRFFSLDASNNFFHINFLFSFTYFAASLSNYMWAICKKELRQFFSSLTGYIAIIVFLLVNGLMLFVFENNILDFGYATLDRFFQLAPWILLLLIPAITMRSFADEFKTGTFELLQTRPLSRWQIVVGKYGGSLIVVVIALIPTIIYFFSIQALSSNEGIDAGATVGSYIGLFFLAAIFTSIGICSSSFTSNSVAAFIISLIACALLYYGFNAISRLPGLEGGADYYVEMTGIDFHYRSISRGLIDTRDIIYFLSVILLFLTITSRNLLKR